MLSKAFAAALAVTAVSAQTFHTCKPLLACPNPQAVGAAGIDIDFTKGGNQKLIKDLAGTPITYDSSLGAVYEIKTRDDSPTVQSNGYIFFGKLEVVLRAASGVGIVTSVVLQSDDLDEIDWEWVGGKNTQVQTNYFSKGCVADYTRGGTTTVNDPVGTFHTYTIEWTSKQLTWSIDGTVVRTLVNTGVKGCSAYPQSPMQIRLGSWVAGKSGNEPGTIEWAGGLANFDQGPFTGYYKSIKVTDYMGGDGTKDATKYIYTDNSGDWQTIKVDGTPGGKDSGDDKSGSKQDTTSSSSSTSSTVTKAPSSTPGSNSTTSSSSTTTTPTKAGTSTTAPAAPTGGSGAGQLAVSLSNAALVGAALFLGALAL